MMWATIDPGLSGTGWAIWDSEILISHGVIHRKQKLPQQEITLDLIDTLTHWKVNRAYIEYPQKFNSAKGDMVANRGDLVKLSVLIGFFQASLIRCDIPVEFVPVNEWKGQMTKEAVIHRINRILPHVTAKSHAWDAIGIGLHIQRKF